VSAVYNGKLHIFGYNTGLYVIDAGSVLPVSVPGTIFDEPNVIHNAACVFGDKLYVGIRSVAYDRNRAIVAWDGSTAQPCIDVSAISNNPDITIIAESDGQLYAAETGFNNRMWQLNGAGVFEVKNVSYGVINPIIVAIGNGKVFYLYAAMSLWMTDIATDERTEITPQPHITRAAIQDGRVFFLDYWSGQYRIQELVAETVGIDGEIKIVGRDANGQYEEPFTEGHRVVVQDSPTGVSREYGIRDGELVDTDGATPDDIEDLRGEIDDLRGEVESVTVIRGNVDTYDDLLLIDTGNMRVNDSYIVESDTNHDDKTAIYTWDGTQWNFTHLWDIPQIECGTHVIGTPTYNYDFFGYTTRQYDVLEVSFSGAGDFQMSVTGINPAVRDGKTLIMIITVSATQTASLNLTFAHKLIEDAELSFADGVFVVTLLKSAVNPVNIATYV
jgi:hypothetical protein